MTKKENETHYFEFLGTLTKDQTETLGKVLFQSDWGIATEKHLLIIVIKALHTLILSLDDIDKRLKQLEQKRGV